ncbi:hypothetical protein D6D10_08772 [Aureobasidium pullulans]|uniref:DUF6604 domain-containing protein n=1 Tax=Aureobasidium pullulans TaxID=5580 RepID=A0A4S9E7B9_AURPU|nr:hypothetical protein D6D10_08772 [Aureobasidium pullulans]
MADQNTYVLYKKDTSWVICWLVHMSNAVTESLAKIGDDDPEAAFNTTGQVTCKELVSMAERVAAHRRQEVPDLVFRLLRSAINARSKAHQLYLSMAMETEDERLEQSNLSHKHFIDSLTEAFNALGGREWIADRSAESMELQSREEIENIIFTNIFSALDMYQCADDMSDNGGDPKESTRHPRKTGKGKRSHKSQSAKNKRQARAAQHPVTLKVPPDNYCIVDGPESLHINYDMASMSMLQEWGELRKHVQSSWLTAAYENTNIAVAGAISEMTIAMIKRTALAVFVEFPEGYDTFEAMSHGFRIESKLSHPLCSQIRELFSAPAFDDLLEFLVDFQKNRSGKPTKRMQARLSSWNPNFDLQEVNTDERMEWRRLYTINWLYDLVNVFSHIVIRENKVQVDPKAYETIQWSIKSQCSRPCRLFGMEPFAEIITTLAMQKPGTNIRSKILPHHVFQLQCIVDAFTASHGWSPCMLNPAEQFREAPSRGSLPTEPLTRFLGNAGAGFLSGIQALQVYIENNKQIFYGKTARFQEILELLGPHAAQARDWLGRSDHVFTSELPSRFSGLEPHGLWSYSPFLCGVGLLEALEISYRLSMLVWDVLNEPLLMVNLHGILRQRGRTVGLDDLLELLSRNCVAIKPRLSSQNKAPNGSGQDIKTALNVRQNITFRYLSRLALYRELDWDPAKISQSGQPCYTILASAISVSERDEQKINADGDDMSKSSREETKNFNTVFGKLNDHGSLSASTQKYGHSEYGPGGKRLLILSERDMVQDICDRWPMSAMDYLWITMKIIGVFEAIEQQLAKVQNPLYLQCDWRRRSMARFFLVTKIAQKQPGYEECLEVVEKELNKENMRLTQFIYWEQLDQRLPSLMEASIRRQERELEALAQADAELKSLENDTNSNRDVK